MKAIVPHIRTLVAVAALFAATSASAALTTIFETGFAQGNLTGEEAKKVLAVRNQYLTSPQLIDVQTESLENIAAGTAVKDLAILGGKAVANTTGAVTNIVSDGSGGVTGRYNTTPGCDQFNACNFIETTESLTISFNGSFSAFAFFGTDFADFDGAITIDLLELDSNNVLSVVQGASSSLMFTSSKTASADGGTGKDDDSGKDGSLMFWGFTDDTRAYAGVRINVTQVAGGTTDVVGFDDFILGNFVPKNGTVPEPATLALVGLSLAGLAATRRRKAAAQA